MSNRRKQPKRLLPDLARLVLIGAVLAALAGTAAQPAQAGPPSRRPPAPAAAGSPTSAAAPPSAAGPTPTPVAAAGGGWSVVPSPNTGSPNNYLYGVAAIAPNDVWAVGAYGGVVSSYQLIEHWDGASWTRAAGPALSTPNQLLAISAVSASDVWAVGGYDSGGQALIEHWNGSTWSVVANPNPGTFNRFFGVAAISSTNVWAVGVFGDGGLLQTLVEHWDGTSWSVVPSPNIPDQHNWLRAVTAVPGSPNELWAVGEAGPSELILHWNGAQWSIVPGPNAGSVPRLMSVVAISANDVWAAGWTGGSSGPVTLTEHWNGSAWSVVASPNPSSTYNYLWGIGARATNDVWAVGDFNAPGGNRHTLILRWNGTAWVQAAGDNGGPSGVGFTLMAVSALSASDVWAVGENSHTLAEHWNGSKWSIVPTPNVGPGDNVLNAVSGSGPSDVWEAGYYSFGVEKRTLIEHWNGSEWSIVSSPNTGKRTNVLNGVVAISAADAWAVGAADSGNAPDQITLTLHWDGTRWAQVPSPSPGTAGRNVLYAVDAGSANDVWAVGGQQNSGNYSETLIMHWNGTCWTVIPSANVPGVNNELYGVVALAPNDVWAVGYSGVVDFVTLVQHWNGSTWSIVPSADPLGSNILRAVAATGANDVWAAGYSRNPATFRTGSLMEHWNGGSWSLFYGVGAGESSALYGVAAVSPADAWVVGDGGGLTLIGRWDGSSWSNFPGPEVTGRLLAATAINACDVWAVGQRYVANVGLQTLNEHYTCTLPAADGSLAP